jgi:hypothetical protein
MEESDRIVLYITLASAIVSALASVIVAIKSNTFKSKCCGGRLCEMEDELQMQDKGTVTPTVIVK